MDTQRQKNKYGKNYSLFVSSIFHFFVIAVIPASTPQALKNCFNLEKKNEVMISASPLQPLLYVHNFMT